MQKEAYAYLTLGQETVAEFTDRGSRFIAYAFPIVEAQDVKARLQLLKKEHPKAVHHCFAWRLGLDGTQYRVSDDGEPSGTAGRPILGQLDARQLTDAAIVVVRYFGGTLLGVPGLIHAYKSSAALALQVNTLVEKPILEPYLLEFDYTLMNEVMTVLKRYPCVIRRQEMQLFCQMDVGIPRLHADNCLRQLGHIFGITVAPAGPGKGSAK
jgi:uncharacterized YigZ family protein